MTPANRLALSATILIVAGAVSTAAGAGPRYGRAEPADVGYVVAESRYGNGTVEGPVRWAKNGRQVRLPGGTWEYCRRSCSETLRVMTVDFWQNQTGGGGGAITNECGIFGCLELRYPR